MTNEQIDRLIAARNRMTDVMVPDNVYIDTSDIDAVLSSVPLGERPDVDALLGRTYAAERARIERLRQRNADAPRPTDRIVSAAVTLEELSDSIIAEMEARCNEQASDGPQYEGMWK
jgi:hypothetical protein